MVVNEQDARERARFVAFEWRHHFKLQPDDSRRGSAYFMNPIPLTVLQCPVRQIDLKRLALCRRQSRIPFR